LGVQCDFLVERDPEDYAAYGDHYEGVNIIYSNPYVRFVKALSRQADVVHCVDLSARAAASSLTAHSLGGVPMTIELNEWEIARSGFAGEKNALLDRALESLLLPEASHIFVCSDFLRRLYRRYSHKLSVLPFGVDLDWFDPNRRGYDQLRTRFLDSYHASYIALYVGALLPAYDVDQLIRAAAVVLARRRDVVFVIVGDGSKRLELQQLAASLGIEDRVVFTGYVPRDDLPKYYSMADISLLPMRRNAVNMARYPQKLMDYMAGSSAIVASPVGVVPSIAGDSVFYAGCEDPDEFAEPIFDLLEDTHRMGEMGTKGRGLLEREYTYFRIAQQALPWYREVVER
jgi:glycosyltransferase involved in cell wall biosynthesis